MTTLVLKLKLNFFSSLFTDGTQLIMFTSGTDPMNMPVFSSLSSWYHLRCLEEREHRR